MRILPALLLALLTLLALLATACSDPGVPPQVYFPPEPKAEDFAGLQVPLTDTMPAAPSSSSPSSPSSPSDPSSPSAPSSTSAGPVWLIGIDGATWDLILPLIDAGILPNLKQLMDEGAHGTLLSEEPTISPALWATVATGFPRHVHGVANFVERRPGTYRTTEAGPRNRRVPALWNRVGAAGGTSAVISWFGSFPAESIAGLYVSKGFDPAKPGPRQVQPTSLTERLQSEAQVAIRRGDLESIGSTEFLRNTLLDDARTLGVLRALPDIDRHALVAVYFAGTDVAQHVTWRHMDPTSQAFPEDGAPDPGLAQAIGGYYRYIDAVVGELRSVAPKNATLAILSDHGAGPILPEQAYHLQLEVLLEQLGIGGDSGNGPLIAIGEMYRTEKRIWLNTIDGNPSGTIAGGDIRKTTQQYADRLRALQTETGDPLLADLQLHLDDVDRTPLDPVMTVRFSDAAMTARSVVDGDREISMDPVRLRHSDVSGGHRLNGILLLHGPQIRPGRLPESNLYQISPTLLYLLGLPQDRAMLAAGPANGGVLEEAILPERLAEFPIRMIDAYPGLENYSPLGWSTDEDPASDSQLEKLRTLGYIR